jgi:hypothetical protein
MNWNFAEMQEYIFENYDVVFDSPKSYYTLFKQAQISLEKQKTLPKVIPRNKKKP